MGKRIYMALGLVAVIVIAGAAITLTSAGTLAGGGDDDEGPITGEALERASAAALEHVGGGRVTETEIEDEESKYEVEITLDDGSQLDFQLDEDFNVVSSETDDDDDDDGDDDDEDD